PAERITKTESDFFDALFFCVRPKPQQRTRADQVLIRVRSEGQQKRPARLANQTVAPVVTVPDGVRKSRDAVKAVGAPIAVSVRNPREIAAMQNVKRLAVVQHRVGILKKSAGMVCKMRRVWASAGRFFEREQLAHFHRR